MKRIVVVPDVHMNEEISKPYQLVKKFIKKNKPDEVILLGDFMDCSSLSHWDESKIRVIEGRRYNSELKLANRDIYKKI